MPRKWTSQWHNKPEADGVEQTVLERMVMLRRQMLLHAYIYYTLDDNIISDHEWDRRSRELFALQQQYGWNINFYDEIFKHWKGQSGFWLPTNKGHDEHVNRVAARQLAWEKNNRKHGGMYTECGTLFPVVETVEFKKEVEEIFEQYRPDKLDKSEKV